MRKIHFHTWLLIGLIVFSSCSSMQKARSKHNRLSELERMTLTSMFIEGTKYRLLGDAKNAVALYEEVLKADPIHDGAMFELGKLKLVLGDLTAAEDLMKQAARLKPDNIWYKLGYATVLEQSKQYNLAAVQYRKLIEENPQSIELYGYEARCYVQINEYQKAIDVYNQLEAITGVSEESSLQKYYIYSNWGKQDKAMNEIQKLSDAFPGNPDYLIALAGYYMDQGKAALSLQCINSILAVEPEHALARVYLADYYYKSGNRPAAIAEIGKVVASPNTNIDEKIELFLNMLKTGGAYGDTTSLYPMLDTLVAVHPTEAKAWAMYADFLNADDRTDEAVDMWKKSLQFDNSKFVIWEMVMSALYENQQYDSLLVYAGEASELFPEQGMAWFYRGAAEADMGKYDKAIISLESALELNIVKKEARTKVMFLLAESYLMTGKDELSDKMYKELLTDNSTNVVAMNSWAYALALHNRNIEKARQLIDAAIQENQDNVDFQHTLGLVYFREGNYPKAMEAYKRSFQLGGEKDGALLEHYADVLYFSGDVPEALRYWQMAREMGGTSELIDRKISDKKYYE